SSSGNDVSMITRVPGSSARMARHASTPDPSGRRTSMTTMSGRYRRAGSIDSATDPAWATTSTPGRRSSKATRPCRTISWLSATRKRRTVSSGIGRGWQRHDDTSAPPLGTVDPHRRPDRFGAVRHVGEAMVSGGDMTGRVEPDAVIRDHEGRTLRLATKGQLEMSCPRVTCCIAERFTDQLQELDSVLLREPVGRARVHVDLDL